MCIDVMKKSGELVSQKKAFAVATVVRVRGSSSAQPGSKAIIDDEGKILSGWVGGGCAESAVRREALQCIKEDQPQLITLDMTDELLGVGMPCGGVMEVYIEPVLPNPELLILGHGRIAETLATLGRLTGFAVIVDDPGADSESFRDVDRLITDDLDLTRVAIGRQTYVVIATQHKGDHLWLQKALESEAAYIALISSRHRASLVMDYVALNGGPAEKLNRVWAPAGLDLGARTPEEIALSVISQIVALRRGGSAQPMKGHESASHSPEETAPKVITQCDV